MTTVATATEKRRSRKTKTLLLLERAKTVTRFLVKSTPGIDGVCLYGSVARGDASEWSDIDLLVIGTESRMTPARLLRRVRQKYPDTRVSLLYYLTPDFLRHYGEGALFVAHVLSEGKILYDRHGLLRKLFARRTLPKIDIADEVQTHLSRLESYEDTRRFKGNFLFCLAHLYSIGKGVIILGLAKKGIREFNRERAFTQFTAIYPSLAHDVAKVREIRPFYSLVSHRRPERLPFSYKNADDKVKEVVGAIKTLAQVRS